VGPEEGPAKPSQARRLVLIRARVFSDPNHIETPNYFVDGGQRRQVIGMTGKLVLLLVVFVDRSNTGIEITHIISARKGEAVEEAIYEEQVG